MSKRTIAMTEFYIKRQWKNVILVIVLFFLFVIVIIAIMFLFPQKTNDPTQTNNVLIVACNSLFENATCVDIEEERQNKLFVTSAILLIAT